MNQENLWDDEIDEDYLESDMYFDDDEDSDYLEG